MFTAVTQATVAATTFVQYAVISRTWGVQALAEYSQLMRARAVLEWIVLLMLPIAAARQLATKLRPTDAGDRERLSLAAVIIALIMTVVCSWVMLFLPQQSATLLFGRIEMATWIPSFTLLLSGFSLCLMVSGLARGHLWFGLVNSLQLSYVAVLPIILLALGEGASLQTVVGRIGCAALVTAVVTFGLMSFRGRRHTKRSKPTLTRRGAIVSLLSYGVPRIATMVAVLINSLALPWLINRFGSPSTLAALNGLLGLITAAALLVAPVGLIMLPHLAKLLAEGANEQASSVVSRMLHATLLVSGAGVIGGLTFLRPLIGIWLGPELARHEALFLAAAFSIPGYLVSEILRSPVDAASCRPWNIMPHSVGAVIAICTFYALYDAGPSLEFAAATGLALGMNATGLLSALVAKRFFTITLELSALNIVGLISLFLVTLVSASFFWLPAGLHMLVGVLALVVYLGMLIRSAPDWLFDMLPRWGRQRLEGFRA